MDLALRKDIFGKTTAGADEERFGFGFGGGDDDDDNGCPAFLDPSLVDAKKSLYEANTVMPSDPIRSSRRLQEGRAITHNGNHKNAGVDEKFSCQCLNLGGVFFAL